MTCAIRLWTAARGEEWADPKTWAFVMEPYYERVKTFPSEAEAKRYAKLSWPDAGKVNSPDYRIVRYQGE